MAKKASANRNFILTVFAIVLYFALNLSGFGGEALGPEGRVYLSAIAMCLVLWLSSCVSTPVSIFILMATTCLTMPMWVEGMTAAKTYKAILAGYTASTYPLLLSAFAISVAVTKTGLGKRLGIMLLKIVGPYPKRLMAGLLIAFPLVNLFVPSVQSTMLMFMAILGGIVEDYQLDKKSNVCKAMYLCLAFASLPDTMYIQTAGAAAIYCNNIITTVFGESFTYFQYMLNGLPLPIILGLFAYFMVSKMFPLEFTEFPGGGAQIRKRIEEFPPMSRDEKYCAVVVSVALVLWITGGTFHKIETGTVALCAAALLFFPKIGVMTFPEAMPKMGWGILLMVGCSSSIATGLVQSGAASWIVDTIVALIPVTTLPLTAIVIGGLVVIGLVAFGFATRASCVNSLLPILATFAIVVAEANAYSFNPRGMATMLFYPMIFSAILPVHSPFLLQCSSSETFEPGEFTKVAIPYVITGMLTCVLCFFTYWRWIGLV